MAFSNGATLVCGDMATPRFGADLAAYLSERRISFLSTVPTLLSTLTQNVPSLRQLVVSGEACPLDLVNRWARPGLTMLNVYGPTETTVNTTAAVLQPGKPVTHRAAAARLRHPCAGRRFAAGAGRREGRAVHWRSGPVARLSEPARAHRVQLHRMDPASREPFGRRRRRIKASPLQSGRPCALERRRRTRIFRPHRQPGQAARLSCRVVGDRGCSSGATRDHHRGRSRLRGRRLAEPCRLRPARGWRCFSRSLAAAWRAARPAACLHGAGISRRARKLPDAGER